MTPLQKFVYATARKHWQDKDAPKEVDPSARRVQRAIR